jgi:ABC-type transport system involved in multi-copper enzyme maturation permease subunit
VSLPFWRQIWRRQRLKVVVVSAFVLLWGLLGPVIYHTVANQLTTVRSLPKAFTNFGSGNLFTLGGTLTIMFEHPFLIALLATIVVGMTAPAIAGARASGILEVLLARPLPRNRLLLTHAAAVSSMLALAVAALIVGVLLGAAVVGVSDQVPASALPMVWLNGFLLFAAFAAFGLAATASFDRSGPAIAVTLGFLLVNYFVEVLGSLWEPAQPYQKLSLFHHFVTGDIIAGNTSLTDLLLLCGCIAVAAAYAGWRFPSRDIAAPS